MTSMSNPPRNDTGVLVGGAGPSHARPPRIGGGAGIPAGRPGVGTGGGAEGERAEPSRRPSPSHGHTG